MGEENNFRMTNDRKYTKPPLSIEQQIDMLEKRGLMIDDRERVFRHLANINYYRLSAYMLPFKEVQNGEYVNQFKQNTSWDKIYNLYVFDRKLRLLIFDIIERIEISIRTQLTYQLSLKYGSHWHTNPEIFVSKSGKNKYEKTYQIDIYKDITNHINKEIENNNAEVFIKHYKQNYSSPEMPPAWMCVEIMYFSELSKICSHLSKRSDKVELAAFYELPPDVFCSWVHTINYVRNLCAHHARLWNRDFNIVPSKFTCSCKDKYWISDVDTVKRRKLYYFCCMLLYLCQTINPTNNFSEKMKQLLNEYKDVGSLQDMGFSEYWENEIIWNNTKNDE